MFYGELQVYGRGFQKLRIQMISFFFYDAAFEGFYRPFRNAREFFFILNIIKLNPEMVILSSSQKY